MATDRTHALRRLAAVLTVSVAVLAVAGCGDEKTDEPTTAGGLTRPGSSLALGETATVPRTSGDGVVEMTVTEISRGAPSDIAEVLEDADGRVPYYVRFDLEVVSGDLQGFDVYDYVTAWTDDEPVPPLVVGGGLPGCVTDYWAPHPETGATMSACIVVVAEEGAPPVDAVRFANDGDYSLSEDRYVEWG